jgi:ABC-type multidrug transport system fused ATPase/permease subunit
VPQAIFLSDDTIGGNIAFGLPTELADEARIEEVSRMAELEEFVLGLPMGYHTKIGERGVRLSGGQRQRIGIARALYRNPSLLLLDEATSALDGATEQSVMDAVFGLERECTMVIITHRLSSVRRCDRIVLLEDGRLAALGSWDELIETSELFRVLVRLSESEV